MTGLRLYEELSKSELHKEICAKEEFRKALLKINRECENRISEIVVRWDTNEYLVYSKVGYPRNNDINLFPMMRYRMETDFEELDKDIVKLMNQISGDYPKKEHKVFSIVRQIDFVTDYLILDVYIDM